MVSCTPCTQGLFEVTIAPLITVQWLKLNSEKQKKKLDMVFRGAIATINNVVTLEHAHYYECQRNGQMHLHGWIEFTTSVPFIPAGLISDMAKEIHTYMPKKYSKFEYQKLYGEWFRYRVACTCIQMDYADECERIATWKDYCTKLQETVSA